MPTANVEAGRWVVVSDEAADYAATVRLHATNAESPLVFEIREVKKPEAAAAKPPPAAPPIPPPEPALELEAEELGEVAEDAPSDEQPKEAPRRRRGGK